ncbi:hypothetical protein [Polaribacter haliotis]|uniref:hypothetical protein n=1 Tax=Polaribacter haliotis TaxID=1888915 RepID=UPI000B4BF1FF|nr:hypothetical protein [Polaribacter haliotis]
MTVIIFLLLLFLIPKTIVLGIRVFLYLGVLAILGLLGILLITLIILGFYFPAIFLIFLICFVVYYEKRKV